MFKTYKIEIQNNNAWHTLLTWYGMRKSYTDGAMMVLDSLYDGKNYRAICEQTQEVYKTVGGHRVPKPA